ncbi:hypothetical protein MNBD_GAMMA26-1716 [hydrothermal vent metagenome]|uniref:Uncharacterized protein n=1 Tax=hydrothermal vent metagenome TaxID=652676 RepID=A0A3B1AQ08_9ZZZZ
MQMINNDFLLKLDFLLQKRDMFPWLMSLGFTQGMVNRLKKGQPPSGELLRALQRTERVSLRWLIDDLGPPYSITRAVSDADATEQLAALLDANDWDITLATADSVGFAVVVHRDTQYKYRGKVIAYRQVEVIAGRVTVATASWLAEQARGTGLLRLEPEDMTRLESGHLGNMELFGWQDARKQSPGLWLNRRSAPGQLPQINPTHNNGPYPMPQERSEALIVNEDQGRHNCTQSTEETELLHEYRQLTPGQRSAIRAVLRSMI